VTDLLGLRSISEGLHANYTLLQRFSPLLGRYVFVFYFSWVILSF